ncbi:hypothetical protein GF337_18060 [candidate division KSB1 bacterium]|nr:hypothetical protein [candidate division KSB1 bacterium]
MIMDKHLQNELIAKWNEYFNKAELPIGFYYTDNLGDEMPSDAKSLHRCVICNFGRVRRGDALILHAENIGCGGGRRYLGFEQGFRPNFEYFLSCGIEGKMEGERYKKSPELVREFLKHLPPFEAPAKYIVFKRWDKFGETEQPDVIFFFATADVLSGLFTLHNYDQLDSNSAKAPFSAGCGSIIHYPYIEIESTDPSAIIGMFDISARPCVPDSNLSFAVPFERFKIMINNMDESFLITDSWKKVQKRI